MGLGFPSRRWLRSVAVLGGAASLFLASVAAAATETADAQASARTSAQVAAAIGAAARRFFDGEGLQARADLAAIAEAAGSDPTGRAEALGTLLEICRRMQANDCLAERTQAYVDAITAIVSKDPPRRLMQAFEADYHLNAARLAIGTKAALAEAAADKLWDADAPATGLVHLRRRALRVNVLLATGSRADAERGVSEVLALAGTVTAPEQQTYEIATVLGDMLATLVELGAYERAYGLYAVSGRFIAAALPPKTPEAVFFHRAAANLLEAVDDGEGAARETDAVLAGLAQLELDPDTRDWLAGWALAMKAALCQDAPDCGVRALEQHPLAAIYRAPGRKPATLDEVAYLAARGVAGASARRPDAVTAAALQGPLGFRPEPEDAALVEAYRLAGAALSLPAGPEKNKALVKLGGRVRSATEAPALAGSWYRPGVFDRLLIGLSLIPATREMSDPEAAFALFQLASRAGPGFDADAMALLASARDAEQRRTAHENLRLRARRDRLEQASMSEMIRRGAAPVAGQRFGFDAARLAELDRLNAALAASDQALARAKLRNSGPNLVTLQRLRGVLAPDEAALALAPVGGEMAYACVRREGMTVVTARPDKSRVTLDARLVEQALSATHAPDEAADGQFPAAAAVRLYDVFLRPFEACLKPGDRVTWISPLVSVGGLPLAALLPRAPPKLGEGYDLAAAEWFVRAHAVSYAGSAAALVASRTGRAAAPARDFLGVGDPVLDGAAAEGLRKAGLGPLPETAAELKASARPFRTAALLTGADATEAKVRAALAPGARLISFATHGVMSGEVEGVGEPALVLTPSGGAAGALGEDGFLTASEIADLELPADFVALSACNTANLRFTEIAQELPALSSAFAQAGVPGVLGTLWPVNSETGAVVVAGLFERLAAAGAPGPAEALAQAQRAYLAAPPSRAHLHPRFWAPFIILGDGGGAR